jgi:acetylornithine deacetylase/succinyl-diaminopimelate desuccinylase-like protein
VNDAADTIVGWVNGARNDEPSLLLAFHLDTFDVFDGWHSDPFTPHVTEGRLYGLGSHDMKAGAACVIGAVEAILNSKVSLAGRLIVAATSDEENWSRGAHAVINSGLLENCRGCLIPEPSAPGTLTVGARGRHVFRLTFRGRAAHAAYGNGINAALDAARVACLLSEPGAIDLGYDEAFSMGGSFCVIGIRSGGTDILVPEQADLFLDRHVLPGETADDSAAQIRSIVERADVVGRWSLTWDDRPTPPPVPYVVPPEDELVRVVQENWGEEVGGDIRLSLARSVADTNHFAVYGDVPTLICGPYGGNTCQANEYVLIDSLLPVTRTYVRSVMDLLAARSR